VRSRRPSDPPVGALVVTLVVTALVLALYLTSTSVDLPGDRPDRTCTERVVYHAVRLRDC